MPDLPNVLLDLVEKHDVAARIPERSRVLDVIRGELLRRAARDFALPDFALLSLPRLIGEPLLIGRNRKIFGACSLR